MRKMKKLSRISLILIGIGSILALTGFFMGGKLGIVRDNSKFKVFDSKETVIKNEELSSFKSIYIASNFNNIDIIKSHRYAIEIQYEGDNSEVNYTIKDEKLVIEESKLKYKGINIDFRIGDSQIPRYIKVYVPSNVDLDSIDVKSDNANITMNDLSASDILLHCEYGNINAENINTDIFKVEMDNGNINIKKLNSNNNAVLKNLYGNIEINDSTFNKLSNDVTNGSLNIGNTSIDNVIINNEYGNIKSHSLTTNGLQIKSDNSKIDLDGEFKGNTSIKSDYGDVKIKTSIPQESYNYSVSCEYGNIKIGKEKFENNIKINNNKENSIDIVSNNGNINIDFK
ncbi:DUF4097 family beta strand repeat-containing protein [Clostridium frigidicarnis]|uniref:Putative adhesin n=1 Tax=Clostridium frigidicarnis TaxID=84698 RepID=A0A1I0YGA4_9CLOT|nr:DUF4097 family beta strand repeat-containing protein [Clostridium frigidicarnis]SFB11388.1 Putative adhesin [Clostridium frigidicarnis]